MNSSVSTSESGATISVSGSRGVVGVSPTGIELGINAGIGQLGISTDYGGGIVVGIGGQKIVWGREGGYIQYRLPGLEVIIEARDCVVVESRKVFGQIVASHTYPDPGCKAPDPDPPKPDPPKPPPSPGTPLPDPPTPDLSCPEVFPSWTHATNDGVFSKEDAIRELYPWLYGDISDTEMAQLFGISTVGLSSVFVPQLAPIKYFSSVTGRDVFISDGSVSRSGDRMGIFSGWHNIIDENGTIILHKVDATEIFFSRKVSGYASGNYIWTDWAYIGAWKYTLRCASPQAPPPPNGNRPPMPQDCCKELAADLADMKEVLAVKEILAGKLTFPWRLRMPAGQGEEVIKDYPNLARAIAQMIDHLGIHPPKLSIRDINNAVAGDQSISNQFPSGTKAFEALMAQIWDNNADTDTITNFLYRLSWLCIQQSMNLARLSGDIQSIKDMIGGETEPTESSITLPFNIGAGIKEPTRSKGFGKKSGIDKRIDTNTEIDTEALLPEFLKIRENPIVMEKFSGSKDIMDMLAIIVLKLESLQGK